MTERVQFKLSAVTHVCAELLQHAVIVLDTHFFPKEHVVIIIYRACPFLRTINERFFYM